jgi:hypothetical protein
MWKRMAATAAFLMSYLNIKEIPVVEGKVNFKDDQNAQLKKVLGDEKAQNVIDALNKELADAANENADDKELQAREAQLKKVRAEVEAMLNETSLSAEEKEKLLSGEEKAEGGDLNAKLNLLKAEQKKNNELIKKLMSDPEGDSPEAIIQKKVTDMKHTPTHLFGTGKQWDAFDKRPWNARLKDGGMKATDFNDSGAIPTLQDDMDHFVRENPQALESLFNDFAELPKQWSRKTGVLDRTSSGRIIPDEIVQGRKKGWAPKNNFKIAAEEGRVFRKKIDITFDGYELQEMENTWVGQIYNKDGSHPWKMSFIGFLLVELVKQQKLDDRTAQVNGIYAKTPDGEGKAGRAINSQNGLLFLYWMYRDVLKKYRPFHLGEVTEANIVDYVDGFIKSIPEVDRKRQGLELQISTEKLGWYRKKAGILYQMHLSDDEGRTTYNKNHPVNYPNIIFQELTDMTNTSFMAITPSKNVEIMDYKTSEKTRFTFTHDKRETNIFADYRLGIRLQFVGTKLLPGEPAGFEKQVVWSNEVPIFDSSTTVPGFDLGNGILEVNYTNIKIDEDFKTDIAAIEGAKPGQVLRITGNTSIAAAQNIKNNEQLLLTADFNMKSGGTLTLFVQPDGKLKELKRTTQPEVSSAKSQSEFSDDIIDAKSLNEFFYIGAASATLAEIINGVENKIIKIYGSDTANVNFTVSNVEDNIKVTSNAVLASKADFIELVKLDGVWTEANRTIAAV